MSDPLSLPSANSQCWRDTATGKIKCEWNSLAMKILMKRVAGRITANPTSEQIQMSAGEIHDFFVKNAKIAQLDLAAILRS